mgnify:CR=1 FL=1
MELQRPALWMKDAYLDFARDWEAGGEPITPMAARLNGHSYEEWLENTWAMETKAPAGFVTASTYFAFAEDGRLAGAISLRHELNAFLLRFGGNIGYGVRPSMRRQGYASAMLTAVLPYAAGLGLTRVLLSCNKTNAASARTIERCGGVLENEAFEEGRVIRRYWITL